ncbi:hypothetical protein O6H91_12G051000 [Diphasiastrum complanatum]|uniref:Uncharacterized protein n=1 Tax=Diphasiastrum complanatum TaxID=34168 RepID=A0ACC2C280_DIPCM|nr:hypothetical protein O6H91_12G051000 [Diphasiastrum complanatum]
MTAARARRSWRWQWQLLTALTLLALLALQRLSSRNTQLLELQNHLPNLPFLAPPALSPFCNAANANGNADACTARKLEDRAPQYLPTSSLKHPTSIPPLKKTSNAGVVYYNWKLFQKDYREMLQRFRIYVYQDAYNKGNAYANVFMRHERPLDPKLGNYFSEHMFKINLLDSTFVTSNPAQANLFFLPFSVNVMRNDPRIRSETSIAEFVAKYVERIRREFEFWNKSLGADHFYVCCHSVGREAAARSLYLQRNAMQVSCSSNIYHKFYVPHKDVPLAQVWPRPPEPHVTPPQHRKRLAFYAGRAQNSRVRNHLINNWGNDPDMDIRADKIRGSYIEAFRRSKYCLHVKGYEVNTARISDAIHYGCVPVIISDHYDLPFANIIDWSKFSVIISQTDIPLLKTILLSISDAAYSQLHKNVLKVRKHFSWHKQPKDYDSFHMTMYQLWLRRNIISPLATSHMEWASSTLHNL